jgi:hypothetical protein
MYCTSPNLQYPYTQGTFRFNTHLCRSIKREETGTRSQELGTGQPKASSQDMGLLVRLGAFATLATFVEAQTGT